MKKGQGAAEYLTTYGWALLAIILVSTLFFIYVFPNIQTLSKCDLEVGFLCNSFLVSSSNASLTLDVFQGTGRDVIVTQLACTKSDTLQFENLTSPVFIPTGQHRQIAGPASNVIFCRDLDNAYYNPGQEQAFSGRICLRYTVASVGDEHVICGRIITAYSYT